MSTYLLTWNPKRWDWDLRADLSALKKHGFCDGRWSCGRSKRIKPGDQMYLLRQGLEPRGIMASGQALSEPYLDRHWDNSRKDQCLYISVRFDALVDPLVEGVLPVRHLRAGNLGRVHWSTQASGIAIAPPAAAELGEIWRAFLESSGQAPGVTPEEILTPALYYEGASRSIVVNAYERDPRSRRACVAHHGTACVVCGFEFATRYGEPGQGFIHVHHLVPLSRIRERYVVDPVRDLRPVCPNCHAMLHRRAEVLSIYDLKKCVRR